MVSLCWLCFATGTHFSIENPRTSYLWHLVELKALGGHTVVVDFDQCAYGLCLPRHESRPIKKATRLLTIVLELSTLARYCTKDHEHTRCMGSFKHEDRRVDVSEFGGAYPRELCRVWARAVCSAPPAPRKEQLEDQYLYEEQDSREELGARLFDQASR